MPALYEKAVECGRKRQARNPHAWATSYLQKIGAFKEGTRELTEKGRNMDPSELDCLEHEHKSVRDAAESAALKLKNR